MRAQELDFEDFLGASQQGRVHVYGASWWYDAASKLWWCDDPQKTGVYCGVTFKQLDNPQFMRAIGLKREGK